MRQVGFLEDDFSAQFWVGGKKVLDFLKILKSVGVRYLIFRGGGGHRTADAKWGY